MCPKRISTHKYIKVCENTSKCNLLELVQNNMHKNMQLYTPSILTGLFLLFIYIWFISDQAHITIVHILCLYILNLTSAKKSIRHNFF